MSSGHKNDLFPTTRDITQSSSQAKTTTAVAAASLLSGSSAPRVGALLVQLHKKSIDINKNQTSPKLLALEYAKFLVSPWIVNGFRLPVLSCKFSFQRHGQTQERNKLTL
jgi:hypothetical protein